MPVRVLVCGCGDAGLHIADAAMDDGRGMVVGLFDPVETQLAKAQAQFPDARAEGNDYERLLDETQPDAVVVAGPDHLHADQTIAAVERGCHVLVEKPLAMTAVDSQRIIDAAATADRHVMTDHTLRYTYPYREMALAAKSGEVGTIFFIQGDYIHDCYEMYRPEGRRYTPWRVDPANPADALLGGGIHCADLMLWTVGSPVTEVFCYGNNLAALQVVYDDCYIMVLRFENGALGKMFVAIGNSGPAWHKTGPGPGGGRIAVYGTEGSLWRGTLFRRGAEPARLASTSGRELVGGHAWSESTRVFLDVIEGKQENPITAREGARAVAVCEAGLVSARTGQPQEPVWFP